MSNLIVGEPIMADHKLKHILYGAGAQVGSKTGSHIIFNAMAKQTNPEAPRQQYPFWYGIGPLNIHYDDWILDVGLPAFLGIAGIATKNQKLKDAAIGASLTGLPLFLGKVLEQTAAVAPWLPFSVNNELTYKAPRTTPTQLANPADPQDQLLVGSKAGSGASVYKPNFSAPPCGGVNANSQMLFV
jgi:hypothetical protein